MLHKEATDFLKQLVETPSPSGFETEIQQIIRKRVSDCADTVTTDVHGNLIFAFNPKGAPRIMLCGHCDEIGLMVTYIDNDGFIYVDSIGGVDPNILPGQRVIIHGKKDVFGIVGKKALHLTKKEEQGKNKKMEDLWIDTGAKDKKSIEKTVSVGDAITLEAGYRDLQNGLAVARGFDDRIGAFAVAEAFRMLARGSKIKAAVFGVSSVQEEVGLRGARTSAYGINPDVGIAVDVGFSSDHPGMDKKKIGDISLGKGPMIARGPNINPVVYKLLLKAAKSAKIKYQVSGESSATGTDANVIQVTRSGVAAGLVSIPNRYMHSPVEVVSLKDVENTATLLAAFVKNLKPGQSFIPE